MSATPEDVDEVIAMAADLMAPLRHLGMVEPCPELAAQMAKHVLALSAALHAASFMLRACGVVLPEENDVKIMAKVAADELERRVANVQERNV